MLRSVILLALAAMAVSQQCGGDLKGPSGTFTTPNYPFQYPNNAICQWNIEVDTGNQVELEFQDFELERASPVFGCSSRDFVTISDDEQTWGPYCGTDMPAKITSKGNKLTVVFRSDESLQYRGFMAEYKEKMNGPPTTPAPTTRMPPTTNCLKELTGDSGFVTSPEHPSDYPNNSDCSYFITMDTNATTMTLKFVDLDIEGGDDKCSMDSLTVHDGPNGNFPELKKVCGRNATAAPITTTGNRVYMRFVTDASNTTGRGFNITWEVTSCEDAGGKCEASCGSGEIEGHTSTCPTGQKCCSQGPFPSACGKRFTSNLDLPHIVGGREAVANSWPWQASLQRPPGTFHYCGGVLISEDWVVTAAHCVHDEVAVSVVLGEHDREVPSGDEVRILATEIIVHEDFINSSPWPNDIALLKLTEKAKMSDKIYPACFPTDSEMPLEPEEECYMTGWGDTKGTGDRTVLNELKIAPLPNEVCRLSWGASILDTNVCLGDGSAGSCQGDSGGPFVCKKEGKFTLGGVTSWGIRGCQTLGYPSVYTRVAKFLPWVTEKINANSN